MKNKFTLNYNVKLKIGMKIPDLETESKLGYAVVKEVYPTYWIDEKKVQRDIKDYYIYLDEQPPHVISYLHETSQLSKRILIY